MSNAEPELEPGYVFYVDEAGQLDFRDGEEAGRPTPYIACAVLLPSYRREALVNILPKDPSSGLPMKCSAPAMAPAMSAEFVRELMRSDFYAGLEFINTRDPHSVSVAKDSAAYSDANRRAQGQRRVKLVPLMYSILVGKAVAEAWFAYGTINGHTLGLADVILDDQSLPAHLYDVVRTGIRSAFEKQGMRIRRIEWLSEEEEPLLLFPDHLAGLIHRNITHMQCVEAWDLLEPARRSERIRIEDGPKFYGLPGKQGGGESPPKT